MVKETTFIMHYSSVLANTYIRENIDTIPTNIKLNTFYFILLRSLVVYNAARPLPNPETEVLGDEVVALHDRVMPQIAPDYAAPDFTNLSDVVNDLAVQMETAAANHIARCEEFLLKWCKITVHILNLTAMEKLNNGFPLRLKNHIMYGNEIENLDRFDNSRPHTKQQSISLMNET